MSRDAVRIQPAMRSILARSAGTLLWCGSIAAGAFAVRGVFGPVIAPLAGDRWWVVPLVVLGAIGVIKVVKETFVRSSRVYTLGGGKVTSTYGVVGRTRVEIPLRHIRQAVLDRSFAERVFGLGTICLTSAGSQTIDLAWVAVSRPEERLAMIERAIREAAGEHVRVIGLAGGVGAGKSLAAKVMGQAGYIVIDADADAKAALDRPEVLGQLVKWWGKRVVADDGRADRRAIAEIVFANPAERARLEGLVHPIVKAGRGELVARARAEGRPGVVIDAPLLFEAGSDAECDHVLFVDAPRADRLARVKATRGWTEAELERREKAQIPLEEKRHRSDTVVVNDAGPEAFEARVREALEHLQAKPSRRGTLSDR